MPAIPIAPTRPTKLLLITSILAFLLLHAPIPLFLALLFYCGIWLAERMYRWVIAAARVACVVYVGVLLVHSISLYIPPEIPMVGRKDELWMSRAQFFALASILSR